MFTCKVLGWEPFKLIMWGYDFSPPNGLRQENINIVLLFLFSKILELKISVRESKDSFHFHCEVSFGFTWLLHKTYLIRKQFTFNLSSSSIEIHLEFLDFFQAHWQWVNDDIIWQLQITQAKRDETNEEITLSARFGKSRANVTVYVAPIKKLGK